MILPIKNTLKIIVGGMLFLALCGCHNKRSVPAGIAEIGCAERLRKIAQVKAQWAAATGAPSNATPTWDDLAPYFRNEPVCPGGGTYTIGSLSEPPTCSIPSHNEYFKAHPEPVVQQ